MIFGFQHYCLHPSVYWYITHLRSIRTTSNSAVSLIHCEKKCWPYTRNTIWKWWYLYWKRSNYVRRRWFLLDAENHYKEHLDCRNSRLRKSPEDLSLYRDIMKNSHAMYKVTLLFVEQKTKEVSMLKYSFTHLQTMLIW